VSEIVGAGVVLVEARIVHVTSAAGCDHFCCTDMSKVCGPAARFVNDAGLVQACGAP